MFILGGTLFFTTFVPSTDICEGMGNGYLYGLYYLSGTAYKESSRGTSSLGSNTVANRSVQLQTGLPSQVALHIEAGGSGSSGTGGNGAGCTGRLSGLVQSSSGVLGKVCGKPTLNPWSRLESWRDM